VPLDVVTRVHDLPERNDHRDAHDTIGECCPPNACQSRLFDGGSKGFVTYSIALGRVIDASFSSSDICAPASGPIKHQMGDDKPIRHDKPVLDQPPPLLENVSEEQLNFLSAYQTYWKFVKTSFAGA